MAILAEGNAAKREDIIVLGAVPLFDGGGNPNPRKQSQAPGRKAGRL